VTTWLVEPRDTLVVRDGRPLEGGAASMGCLPFPWPSSTAGFVRTRIGLDSKGHFRLGVDEARAIAVAGPWLVALDQDGEASGWLVPAPRDCVWFRETARPDHEVRYRLRPAPLPAGARSDLGTAELVQPADTLPDGKPAPGPAFWGGAGVLAWLLTPQRRLAAKEGCFGLTGLLHESRTHVSVDAVTRTADEGRLFSTRSLRFVGEGDAAGARYALGVACDDSRLEAGVGVLGGERRPSFLRRAGAAATLAFPQDFPEEGERLRVLLVTPALFEGGHAPERLLGAEVLAAAVGRYEVVTGWDLDRQAPKRSRRMAPAGSVYWVRVPEGQTARDWARAAWMRPVSDDAQDRRDGFGLCLVGVG